MRRLVLLIAVFLCSIAFAQDAPKYLHVSTNPSYADAYVGTLRPNHSRNPDSKLPGFIKILSQLPFSRKVSRTPS